MNTPRERQVLAIDERRGLRIERKRIVASFASHADAERARTRLVERALPPDALVIHGGDGDGHGSGGVDASGTAAESPRRSGLGQLVLAYGVAGLTLGGLVGLLVGLPVFLGPGLLIGGIVGCAAAVVMRVVGRDAEAPDRSAPPRYHLVADSRVADQARRVLDEPPAA